MKKCLNKCRIFTKRAMVYVAAIAVFLIVMMLLGHPILAEEAFKMIAEGLGGAGADAMIEGGGI